MNGAKLLELMETQSTWIKLLFGLLFILVLGIIDLLTGYELSFSLFYIMPVSLMTWISGRKTGTITAGICAIVWYVADKISGHVYSNYLIGYWNLLIRGGIFLTICHLLSVVKEHIRIEQTLSRTDNLTGAVNARQFYALAEQELHRLKRYGYSFTLVYIDLDNFKSVNDESGHLEGDKVLQVTVNYMKKHLRETDIVARVGGDEFAIILPYTNEMNAKTILEELKSGMVREMLSHSWPVTFSIGAIVCIMPPDNVKELVRKADDLMYEAKHASKNTIRYGRIPDYDFNHH